MNWLVELWRRICPPSNQALLADLEREAAALGVAGAPASLDPLPVLQQEFLSEHRDGFTYRQIAQRHKLPPEYVAHEMSRAFAELCMLEHARRRDPRDNDPSRRE